MLRSIIELFAKPRTADVFLQDVSPDAMIVNGMMQSFASEYDDWLLNWRQCNEQGTMFGDMMNRFPDFREKKAGWSRQTSSEKLRKFKLINDKKKIEFIIEYAYHNYYKGASEYPNVLTRWAATVNGVEINSKSSRQLADAYLALKAKHDAAKTAAEKALAEMKANEAKWNLAEQILNMKRTKSGRLIAASSYCPVCDASEVDKEAKHNLSCPNAPQPKPRRPKVIKEPFPKEKVAKPVKALTAENKCDCDMGEFCTYCK